MITVLLPIFNSAATIECAIKSILRQSFRDFELLVIDDGSTDRSEEIISNLKDNRIRYHKLVHQGLTKTLNAGLSLANYNIIARMDGDDISVPWRLQCQQEELLKCQQNVILSAWYAVFQGRSIQFVVKTPTKSDLIKKGLLLHSFISHPGLMCYKKTLIDNGGYISKVEIDAFQDYETWLKIKDRVEFKNIPEVLTFQRFRSDSLSNNITYKQKVLYSIQEPYYADLRGNFGIEDPLEQLIYRGWREYFFGKKEEARKIWRKLGLIVILKPRVMLAFIITYLPMHLFIRFKEARVKYRLQYLVEYYSGSNKYLRNELKRISG